MCEQQNKLKKFVDLQARSFHSTIAKCVIKVCCEPQLALFRKFRLKTTVDVLFFLFPFFIQIEFTAVLLSESFEFFSVGAASNIGSSVGTVRAVSEASLSIPGLF